MLQYNLKRGLLQRIIVDMGTTWPQINYDAMRSWSSNAYNSTVRLMSSLDPNNRATTLACKEHSPRLTAGPRWVPTVTNAARFPSPAGELRAEPQVTTLSPETIMSDVEEAARTLWATFAIWNEGPDAIPARRPLPHGHMHGDPIAGHTRNPVCHCDGVHPVMRQQSDDKSSITAWRHCGGHWGCVPARSAAIIASWWLRTWNNAKEHWANHLTSFFEGVPPWQDMGHGRWFVAGLKTWKSCLRKDVDSFHSTSMHMLHQIVAKAWRAASQECWSDATNDAVCTIMWLNVLIAAALALCTALTNTNLVSSTLLWCNCSSQNQTRTVENTWSKEAWAIIIWHSFTCAQSHTSAHTSHTATICSPARATCWSEQNHGWRDICNWNPVARGRTFCNDHVQWKPLQNVTLTHLPTQTRSMRTSHNLWMYTFVNSSHIHARRKCIWPQREMDGADELAVNN